MSPAKSSWIVDVSEADFEKVVLQQSHERPVVVDFWAAWCQPCRMLGPILERLANERAGAFVLAKVDVDRSQQLAAEFGIEGIPAVKAIRDGKVALEFVGLLPEPQLRDFIDRICPSEADKLAQQAKDLEAKNAAKAEQLYRQALGIDLLHEPGRVGLARILLERDLDSEAEKLLDQRDFVTDEAQEATRLFELIDLRRQGRSLGEVEAIRKRVAAEPKNAQLQYELGYALAVQGKYQEALVELLAAATADRKLAAGPVRELMVKIFKIIGVRSNLADEYRDKLSKLLY